MVLCYADDQMPVNVFVTLSDPFLSKEQAVDKLFESSQPKTRASHVYIIYL